MVNNNYLYKQSYIKAMLFLTCAMVSVFTIDLSNHQFRFLFLLPLVYGIILVITPQLFLGFSLRTPGFFILNIVLLLRYLALPLVLKLSGYHRDMIFRHNNSISEAILLMVVEIVTIGICLFYFSNIYKLKPKSNEILELENGEGKPKYFIIFIILLVFILIILSDPSVLKTFSFISIEEGFSTSARKEQVTAGTLSSLALVWFRLLFPILWIKLCKYKYNKSKLVSWVYLATLVPIISLLFFSGMSRSSILIPALALALILGRTFPKQKRKMYSIILTTTIFSVTVLTIYKSFSSTSVSEGFNMMDIKWLSNYLEAYFGGVYNVAISIDAKSMFEGSITINTLFSDLFRSWMGIGSIFRNSYSTSEIFNIAFYGGPHAFDQVVPTIGSSYIIFGLFGSMIFTIIIIWFICLFEYKYKKETSIELAYLYGFSAVQSAFNLPGNFLILSSFLLNTFLPLYFIFKINQLIVLKRK